MFASAKNAMQDAKSDMENEGGRTLRNAKRDAAEGARNVKGDIHDTVNNLKHDTEELARQTGRHARELAEAAGEGISEVSQNLTSKIRENPLQSAAVALLAGVFVGMLYSRK